MGEKKEEDLYRNFSRKDLQGLCKKYGLPANKSNSEMATSLILYLERKNICSKTIWDVSRSDPYPSLWSELQPEARMNSDGVSRADLRATSSQNGLGTFRKHKNPEKKDLRYSKGPSSDKASEDMGHFTKLHRDSNSGAGDAENVFSSVLSSTADASLPSFTFDVSCEDGIQLCVDLNSNTTDWVESTKAELHICHDSQDYKPSSCDDKLPSNHQLEEDESCPTIVETAVALQADEIGGVSRSQRPEFFRNTVHNLENNLGEERATLSSLPKSDSQHQNQMGTNSNLSLVTQMRTNHFLGNDVQPVPCDPTCSKTGDDMYREPCWQQNCTSQDPVFKNTILSGTPFVGMNASQGISLFQSRDIPSSSRVATCLVSADQSQNSRIVQFGSFDSGSFRDDVPQVWPVQAFDRSQYASSSYFMGSLSDARHQVGAEHGRVSVLSKYGRQVHEAQAQFFRSCEKNMSFVTYQNSPLTNVNLDTSIKMGNGGYISANELPRQVAVELPTKDASLSSFNFGGPLDLAVPKKNRSDHPVFYYSNKLDDNVCRSQVRSNLGFSNDGDGNKRSAFKAFRQMEESRPKAANSDHNEFKMKSHFTSIDDRCQSSSPVGKILRTSKPFSGDARASRRRSTRPFTK